MGLYFYTSGGQERAQPSEYKPTAGGRGTAHRSGTRLPLGPSLVEMAGKPFGGMAGTSRLLVALCGVSV
jgi:hypothetical protein